MNIFLAVTLFFLGLVSSAQAQDAGQPDAALGSSPQSQGAMPEIPSADRDRKTGTSATLPDQTPPIQQDIIPNEPNEDEGLLVEPEANQPGFQRDVVPRSTERERHPSVYPSPGTAQTEDDSAVQPDLVPDRRFETFDSDTQGTPEAEPMPNRDDSFGGTRGLPAGGYGIGVPGQ